MAEELLARERIADEPASSTVDRFPPVDERDAVRYRWDPVYPTTGSDRASSTPTSGPPTPSGTRWPTGCPGTSPTAGSTRSSSRPGWTGPWGRPPGATSTASSTTCPGWPTSRLRRRPGAGAWSLLLLVVALRGRGRRSRPGLAGPRPLATRGGLRAPALAPDGVAARGTRGHRSVASGGSRAGVDGGPPRFHR